MAARRRSGRRVGAVVLAVAEQLGVSFIPVRESLRVLEAEGLVVNPPGRSATVAPLDLDELHAIYRSRRLLEPDLAAEALDQHLSHNEELARNALSHWDARVQTSP